VVAFAVAGDLHATEERRRPDGAGSSAFCGQAGVAGGQYIRKTSDGTQAFLCDIDMDGSRGAGQGDRNGIGAEAVERVEDRSRLSARTRAGRRTDGLQRRPYGTCSSLVACGTGRERSAVIRRRCHERQRLLAVEHIEPRARR
jgi:hypothetical protein